MARLPFAVAWIPLASIACLVCLADCGSGSSSTSDESPDGSARDAANDATSPHDGSASTHADASPSGDAGDASAADAGPACFADENPGQCVTVAACALISGYASTPGTCTTPPDTQCCAPAPNVANNPPVPVGYELVPQSSVTTDMTAWAQMILDAHAAYPMYATATKTFGTLVVLARVEWHPPDFQDQTTHRGVTLYEPK